MATLPEALNLAAQALAAGDRARAQLIFQQILKALPEEPNALNSLGMMAYQDGVLDIAADFFCRASTAAPGDATFPANLHLVYRRQGRLDQAIACCRQAVALDPDSAELHNNLGVVLGDRGAHREAAASLRRSVALKPDFAPAHFNLANVLVKLEQWDEAEAAFRRALELAPDEAETYNNLGTLLELRLRVSEAMACYDRAITLQSDSAGAHRNRALLRLLLGDYAQGWPEYEWRWRIPGYPRPACAQPQWQGQPAPGGTVLLLMEQGVGDTIQFARYAPLVKERSGGRVVLVANKAWHPLLSTAPGIDKLVAPEDPQEPFDCFIPLFSLPATLGTLVETIPASIPYLAAEPQRIASWRREFEGVSQLKVGINWQGNPEFAVDALRSIPLRHFAPLAACPNVKLYSLQKNFGREQLAALAGQMQIVDLGATLDEGTGAFVDTAAVMMNLDLVITSDTAMAHLAGALGVPVWVALQLRPNWRFLLDRDDSPWYPSMRLFRQRNFGDWADVFERIAAELQSFRACAQPG